MKTKKKIVSSIMFVLVCCACLCLCACGDSKHTLTPSEETQIEVIEKSQPAQDQPAEKETLTSTVVNADIKTKNREQNRLGHSVSSVDECNGTDFISAFGESQHQALVGSLEVLACADVVAHFTDTINVTNEPATGMVSTYDDNVMTLVNNGDNTIAFVFHEKELSELEFFNETKNSWEYFELTEEQINNPKLTLTRDEYTLYPSKNAVVLDAGQHVMFCLH